VVVTAQKREQKLIDVGASVASLGAETTAHQPVERRPDLAVQVAPTWT
jgi:hypothetical protein